MNKLELSLLNRRIELEKQLNYINKYLENSPSGKVRVSMNGKNCQYYLSTPETRLVSKNGTYIRRKDEDIARRIVTRDYYEKTRDVISGQLKLLNQAIADRVWDDAYQVYDEIKYGLKPLVTPLYKTDQEYLDEWIREAYQGKTFAEATAEIYSDDGVRVRSKSEKIIADYMSKYQIPYKYEKPLSLYYNGRLIRTVYPDFTILDVWNRREIYFEHFGKMSDLDYVRKTVYKINTYEKCGIHPGDRLLMSFECDGVVTDMRVISQMLEPYRFEAL